MRNTALLLLLALSSVAVAEQITVLDPAQAPVAAARVELRSPQGTLLFAAQSDAQGHIQLPPSQNRGVLRVSAAGFADSETPFDPAQPPTRIQLEIAPSANAINVTASRGSFDLPQDALPISASAPRQQTLAKSAPTTGHALEAETGILLQQSSAAQVSPFLRGLTGYQVLNLVDGVRFNNSTFRSGPNQYLAFLEPSASQRVEAILGSAGAAYGSDAMGGAIQVLTVDPRFAPTDGFGVHGEVGSTLASADLSGTLDAMLQLGTSKAAFLVGINGRRHNDLRAGGGVDSRNIYTKFLGLPLDQAAGLTGNRMQDSGFDQYGIHTKLALRPSALSSLTFYYQGSRQQRSRGYKDLIGGLGRLRADFTPQILDFGYARYEKVRLGFLDSLSATFSANSQSDGFIRQNLRFTDPLTIDDTQVRALGYTAQANAHHLPGSAIVFGAEWYGERINATRSTRNPLTQATAIQRPLYPDDSNYRIAALYGLHRWNLLSNRLRLEAGGRLTLVRFATLNDPRFNIIASQQSFHDFSYHAGALYKIHGGLGVHFNFNRGFRAPNSNDLGAVGLNDLGFEIPAADAVAAGAFLSNNSSESATSLGRALQGLKPETIYNFEGGLRWTSTKAEGRIQYFRASLQDPILRRTLLFPQGAVPATLAGQTLRPLPQTAPQAAQGVVMLATPVDPRGIKAFVNDGETVYYGVEALGRLQLSSRWSLRGNYSYLIGRDLFPNRNVRRLPPPQGMLALRYLPSGRRPWFEVSAFANAAQTRLSGGDRDDERIGASRSRADIANFFGSARFIPATGETLLQVQNRLLPGIADSIRVPLYLSTAGWLRVDVISGIPLTERLSVNAGIQNLLDKNYRVHGSGVDAPGFNAFLSLRYRW
jgi:hemoglobin/transferrin/lactoferrin receptor protein